MPGPLMWWIVLQMQDSPAGGRLASCSADGGTKAGRGIGQLHRWQVVTWLLHQWLDKPRAARRQELRTARKAVHNCACAKGQPEPYVEAL